MEIWQHGGAEVEHGRARSNVDQNLGAMAQGICLLL